MTRISMRQVPKKLTNWMKRIEARIEKLEKKHSNRPKISPDIIKKIKQAMKKKHY